MSNELVTLLHAEFDVLDKQVISGWLCNNRPLFARYTALMRIFEVRQRKIYIPATDKELFDSVKHAINNTASLLVEETSRYCDVMDHLNHLFDRLNKLYGDTRAQI